ncbi:NAD(P)/FAD-dependent oxidoreductase [Candidatus Giovannonibacteria bacterium]|nr:NAD(P)/FAD-dependent oxidoreductase [Candidatus Giovannonibacteria bacterium]
MVNGKKPVRIVILGAGFGGSYAFKRLHKFFHKDQSVELILVDARNYFLFTPLLHEVATGSVARENIVEPLRKVLGCCLAEFCLADVKRVELQSRRVITTNGSISYDYLIMALGAETNFYNIPGAREHSFTLKSLENAVRLKNHFIKKFEEAAATDDENLLKNKLCFVVVGGGPTGVELAAEMSELFYHTFSKYYGRHFFYQKVKIALVQNNKELLPRFSKKLRDKSLSVLQSKKIDVKLGVNVKRVVKTFIELSTGEILPTETVIWVAGVKPRDVLFDRKIERDSKGRIRVNEYLQMYESPEVFALGDIAAFAQNKKELPEFAQVATKQARGVAENIKNLIDGKPARPFHYRHTGDLISLGQWMAIGEIGGFPFWGRFTWWLWRTVYLSKLISFPKKVKVAVDWTFNLFMPRDISQL